MGSIKKAFDLTGKNALVTGGSRGLGLQIAEALGEQGARVVISSRKAPDLEKAQAHLAGLGIKAEWIAADNSGTKTSSGSVTKQSRSSAG
jgi:NAD(P)-dependent dehydrogenase (short-subunit alcohol dehydrogenase family)